MNAEFTIRVALVLGALASIAMALIVVTLGVLSVAYLGKVLIMGCVL